MGMRSTADERCQHRQAAQRALGRPVLQSKHHPETEMLQPPGSPRGLRPSAPPLDSHLAEGREKHKPGQPQTSPRANSQCQLLPSEDNTPQKCTGTPLLRGGCQTCPLSPPTPPPPLRLAWGALTCHAASLGQGGLLPTCREESRRVTDSFHFQHSFKAQTSLTQDQIHAESMVLSERSMTDPRQAVLLHRAKDSSCLPRGAQGTLSSQSAGAGPREKQSPCRPVK